MNSSRSPDYSRGCSLYVDAHMRERDLVEMLTRETNGSRNPVGRIKSHWGHILVDVNDYWSKRKAHGPDGFLHYRYHVDLLPFENTLDYRDFVIGIRSVLEFFHRQGIRVVPISHFSEEFKIDGMNQEPEW